MHDNEETDSKLRRPKTNISHMQITNFAIEYLREYYFFFRATALACLYCKGPRTEETVFCGKNEVDNLVTLSL